MDSLQIVKEIVEANGISDIESVIIVGAIMLGYRVLLEVANKTKTNIDNKILKFIGYLFFGK